VERRCQDESIDIRAFAQPFELVDLFSSVRRCIEQHTKIPPVGALGERAQEPVED
jgi:hypothetical protein